MMHALLFCKLGNNGSFRKLTPTSTLRKRKCRVESRRYTYIYICVCVYLLRTALWLTSFKVRKKRKNMEKKKDFFYLWGRHTGRAYGRNRENPRPAAWPAGMLGPREQCTHRPPPLWRAPQREVASCRIIVEQSVCVQKVVRKSIYNFHVRPQWFFFQSLELSRVVADVAYIHNTCIQ